MGSGSIVLLYRPTQDATTSAMRSGEGDMGRRGLKGRRRPPNAAERPLKPAKAGEGRRRPANADED